MQESTSRQAKEVSEKTTGEFVAEDYRAATVFDEYEVDFCGAGPENIPYKPRLNPTKPRSLIKSFGRPINHPESYLAKNIYRRNISQNTRYPRSFAGKDVLIACVPGVFSKIFLAWRDTERRG